MSRSEPNSLLALTQSFFLKYLQSTRGASSHTMRAYRDALKLFFLFLAGHKRKTIAGLDLDDVQAESVLKFLDHIESKRGNSAVTRNCRLAAIRSFTQHLLQHDVTRAGQYGRILAIGTKRATHRAVAYLEPEEARAVIGAVDTSSPGGRRDHALLLLLYNTGARISEALAVRSSDLRLDRPRQVRFLGKGRKERLCPLWPETASALRRIIRVEGNDVLFQSHRGTPLTRDGAAYLLQKYVRLAVKRNSAPRLRRVTPHMLRHSCAVALLQAGVDVTVIRDYLGHASVSTTSRYITTNLQMKRQVLDAFWKRAGLAPTAARKWHPSPKMLAFLNTL
ncbi:MAG: tyrosine-type recombinase/integrase [Candidatus Solibacter sp.]